ncbi:MAG: endonuclease, partial [Candidatus Thiodiazotropha sp. (ex Lucinoma annulata)]|nr:endonuclease [Candidatus Thiodiazotropha sp. (ex Lucinoma annulata)]
DILLYAFNRPVFVIDAYTRRLFSRLGLVEADIGYESMREEFERVLDADPRLFNEYHALIVIHAKEICRPRPMCGACPLVQMCSYAVTT